MSFIGDALEFEKFHLSDIWDRLKDDPKRLLLGVDPASTWVWNKALGRDDEPIMNQLGGAMGSGFLGLGDRNGVYGRAQEAGIDTEAGNTMQNIAETIAMMYGAAGIGGAFGGGGSGAGAEAAPTNDGGFFQNLGNSYKNKFDFQNMNWKDPNTYMNFAQNMPSGGGGGLPLSAGPPQESEEDRLARQHREELLRQAMLLAQQQQGANADPGSFARILYS